jgi:hypothetical protein
VNKFLLLSITAGFALALVAGGIWIVRRRIKKPEHSKEPDITAIVFHQEAPEIMEWEPPPTVSDDNPQEPSANEKSKFASEKLVALTNQIQDSDLKDFLREITARVNETGPCLNDETPFSFIEEIVDRLDDLQTIVKNPGTHTPSDIESFRNILIAVLAECSVELIHSDLWDVSSQRAVAKEITPGIVAPVILRYGSTGIRRHGQLVRKQEVVLAVPETY